MSKTLRKHPKMPQKRSEPQTEPLQAARTTLADAISGLIDPKPYRRTLELPDGHTRTRTEILDSLYTQLATAIGANSGPGTRHHPGSSLPFWVDGFDLLVLISLRVDEWQHDYDPFDNITDPTICRLRVLDTQTWRPQDTRHIERIAAEIDGWTKQILAFFQPKPLTLPDPCPECGRHSARKHLAGEEVNTPALEVTLDGARCRHCRHEWAPNELSWLGRLLGYPPPAGVTT